MVNNEKLSSDAQGPSGGIMIEIGTDPPVEHGLSEEDAVCGLTLFFVIMF